jgi:hypothetical protein
VRLLGGTAAIALVVLAAPVTVIALAAAGAGWLRGWPPARLYRAAAFCAPMVVVWLAATGLRRGLLPAARAPWTAWLGLWHAHAAGPYVTAMVLAAPAAVPLGLLAGGLAWSLRVRSMAALAGGRSPAAVVAFDRRQWAHQVRTARARIAAPGSVPLLTADGDMIAGAVIRAVGHQASPLTRLPSQRLRSHQLVIGTTGTGKTTLLLRLWAAFMAAGLRRHAAGQSGPPLLVVLDCKGGADARRIADRARRVLREAGARSVAVWPDEASLNLWALPPPQLITTLVDLIEHGTGGAAYYTDVMDAVVALAIGAPGGPPASSADFLARLDPGWLTLAYSAGGLDDQLQLARAAATRPDAARRQILLAVDEFSAVSRRLPIWQLYERARSLGLAVQVSAQSWHGLAPAESDRYRIAAAAEGGIWLLRSAHPEPVTGLAGQRTTTDTSRYLLGFPRWSRTGTSRLREVPVADTALIRILDVGQAAYLYRGGVTYTQVKRLVAGPAAVSAGPPGQRHAVAAEAVSARPPPPQLPDVSAFLDAAFGPATTAPGRRTQQDAP